MGIAVNKMGSLEPFLYAGEVFDDNVCPICPRNIDLIPAIWAFLTSSEYNTRVRSIDKSLKVTAATLTKVPFDIGRWSEIALSVYPNGIPGPYSDDVTQWLFHGHPCGSVIWDWDTKQTAYGSLRIDETVLQVAMLRLLGYRWPMEVSKCIELDEIQQEWVKRCDVILPYADGNGIVCLPSVRGEAPAVDRLLNLLAVAYGDSWSNDILQQLLLSANHAGKTLDSWIRDKFFIHHNKIFQNRPFVWHIWDGVLDGFAVLVNYHQLDKKKLETIIYTYLGDWINRQKQELIIGTDGAAGKLAAAEGLRKRLEMILVGEEPYDIFVRWKSLSLQPIGWEPDINDGVRLNIRPFLSVPDVGKKGAGVLRDRPNINWNKDRGQDIKSAPWYRKFQGERINDYHLKLEAKQKAREEGDVF